MPSVRWRKPGLSSTARQSNEESQEGDRSLAKGDGSLCISAKSDSTQQMAWGGVPVPSIRKIPDQHGVFYKQLGTDPF
jgi:hypothetical protein